MEVSTNHLFSSSARLISNSITLQPFDSKLTAFYTILTVALSIMLSFKQSRYILINATTTYPIRNVKKCIRRLKCLKTGKTYENSDSLKNGTGVGTGGVCEVVGNSETSYYRYIRLLKLKRLRTFASNIKYITTNTLNISSNNYLYKTLNATFTKMKRTASLRRNNNFNENGQINGLGLSMGGGVRRLQFNKSRFSKIESGYSNSFHNCSSMPNFSMIDKKTNDFENLNKPCNTNRGLLIRSKSLPKLKFSKVRFLSDS